MTVTRIIIKIPFIVPLVELNISKVQSQVFFLSFPITVICLLLVY